MLFVLSTIKMEKTKTKNGPGTKKPELIYA